MGYKIINGDINQIKVQAKVVPITLKEYQKQIKENKKNDKDELLILDNNVLANQYNPIILKSENKLNELVIEIFQPYFLDVNRNESLLVIFKELVKYLINSKIKEVAIPIIEGDNDGGIISLNDSVRVIEDFENEINFNILLVLKKGLYDEEAVIKSIYEERMKTITYADVYLDQFMSKKSLDEILKSISIKFSDQLLIFMKNKGLDKIRLLKKANTDVNLINKIDLLNYNKPSKISVIALIFSLELHIKEAEELLSKAGYILSDSIRFDLIIRYFIENSIYNLFVINNILYKMKEPFIGIY